MHNSICRIIIIIIIIGSVSQLVCTPSSEHNTGEVKEVQTLGLITKICTNRQVSWN